MKPSTILNFYFIQGKTLFDIFEIVYLLFGNFLGNFPFHSSREAGHDVLRHPQQGRETRL